MAGIVDLQPIVYSRRKGAHDPFGFTVGQDAVFIAAGYEHWNFNFPGQFVQHAGCDKVFQLSWVGMAKV